MIQWHWFTHRVVLLLVVAHGGLGGRSQAGEVVLRTTTPTPHSDQRALPLRRRATDRQAGRALVPTLSMSTTSVLLPLSGRPLAFRAFFTCEPHQHTQHGDH